MTSVLAVADFASVLPDVAFQREGTPIALQSYAVPLRFARPNGEPDIERVLLDPTYIPPNMPPQADDFTLHAEVQADGDADPLSSVGLCKWDGGKITAECGIEDDGGRYRIKVISRGATLQLSEFVLQVGRFGGYDGFYIGTGAPEPDASIYVGPVGAGPVDVPIRFL